MTVYALRLESGTDTAPRTRMGDGLGLAAGPSLLATRSGIRPETGAAAVTAVAGTMQVQVAPFMGWVDGGVSVAQAGYPVVSDAAVTLTLSAGDATLSRTDVVAVVVRDTSFDSSTFVDARVTVVQGTPGAGTPALPTNALAIARVTVPAGLSAGTGGLSGSNITDARTWLAQGGPIPVASQTERDALSLPAGAIVYRLDANALEVRTASGWDSFVRSSAAVTNGAHADASGTTVYARGGMGYLKASVTATAAVSVGDVLCNIAAAYRPPTLAYGELVNTSTNNVVRVHVDVTGDVTAQAAVTSGQILRGQVVWPI